MCGECGYRTDRESHLSQHTRTHTGEKPFKCDQCDYSARLKSTLVKHIRTHTGEKPYMCGECGYRAAQMSSLSKHMTTHTGDKPYKCDQCSFSSTLKCHLNKHIAKHTRDTGWQQNEQDNVQYQETYNEDFCGGTQPMGHPLNDTDNSWGQAPGTELQHDNEMDDPNDKVCGVKAEMGESSCELSDGELCTGHSGNDMDPFWYDKPYMCGECGYRTDRESHLSQHMRTHTGEKPFKCDQCDYSAAVKSTLVSHLRTHTGEKPYMCGECGFMAAQKSSLSKHMTTHTGDKPYKCDQCSFFSTRKYHLNQHKAKHTRDTGWQQNEQDNVLYQKTYNEDFCGGTQPIGHSFNDTDNSLGQTQGAELQQDNEMDDPNDKVCNVKAEIGESSCELSDGELHTGHSGNEHIAKHTRSTGWQQNEQDNVLCHETYNEDFFARTQPNRHPLDKTDNSWGQNSGMSLQQDEEKDNPNVKVYSVKEEIGESSCELSVGELCTGHSGKDMDHPGYPGKKMDCTEHFGKESDNVAQKSYNVNFPQPNSISTSLVQESRGNMGRHVVKHSNEKPFACKECPYSTYGKSDLSRHMRTHTGEKPYKCDQCDYSAAVKSTLVKHLRTHTGEKPYMCGECGYRTAQMSCLSKHMRTHTGDKPYKCDQCSYSAVQKSHLDEHILAKHTRDTGRQQNEQDNVLCHSYSEDFFDGIQPAGHPLNVTDNNWGQARGTTRQRGEERDVPNDKVCAVKVEMGESSCEPFVGELHTGHSAKDMDHPVYPGEEMDCTEHPGKESDSLQQKTYNVNFPQPDSISTSRVQNTGNMGRHVVKHLDEKPFACKECPYSTYGKSQLTQHMRTHTGEKPFKCDQCGYSAAIKSTLVKHLRTHTGEKPYMCGECGYRAAQMSSLSKHMTTHIGDKPYKCDQCSFSSTLKCHLNKHIAKHTGDTGWQQNEQDNVLYQETYNEDFCGGTQPTGHPLNDTDNSWGQAPGTKLQEDNEMDIPNDKVCGENAEKGESSCEVSDGELCTGHSGNDMDPFWYDRPYMCGECGYRTGRESHLSQHMRTHTGEKPFKCDQCDYSAAVKSTLVSHLRTHTGEKPYMCGECGFRAAQKSSLSKHMRTHTGDKPYKCDQGRYSAIQKSHLDQHIAKHRGDTGWQQNEQDNVLCQGIYSKDIFVGTEPPEHPLNMTDNSWGQAPGTTRQQKEERDVPNDKVCGVKVDMGESSCELSVGDFCTGDSMSNMDPPGYSGEAIDCTEHFGTESDNVAQQSYNVNFPQADSISTSQVQESRGNMGTHVVTHTNEKPFACKVCPYSTYGKSDLSRHMRTHTGQKPYKCDQCDYSAAVKSTLVWHLRTHTGVKSYKCDQCRYSAVQKSHLDEHILANHTRDTGMTQNEQDNVLCHGTYSEDFFDGIQPAGHPLNVTDNNWGQARGTTRQRGEERDVPNDKVCAVKVEMGESSCEPFVGELHTGHSAKDMDHPVYPGEEMDCTEHPGKESDSLQQKTYNVNFPQPDSISTSRVQNTGNMGRHVVKHLDEKPFACKECPYSTYGKSQLTQHMRTHTGEKPFKCDQCGYSAAVKSTLVKHLRTHTGEKPYMCGECGYRAAQMSSLSKHMTTHTGDKPYKCDQCSFSSTLKCHLSQHIANHTRDTGWQQNEQDNVLCQEAYSEDFFRGTQPTGHPLNDTDNSWGQTQGTARQQDEEMDIPNDKVFGVKTEMRESSCELSIGQLHTGHSGKDLDHPGYPGKEPDCTVHLGNESDNLQQKTCEVNFPQPDNIATSQVQESRGNMGWHVVLFKHSNEKPFACKECPYSTYLKSDLSRHMRTHTGEKPYKCDQCAYSAAVKSSLVKHLRTHTGEKPYMCGECGYRTAQMSCLSKHMRTHTGDKPYRCDQCSYSATRKSYLDKHKVKHTGQ
ncbi:zinc finger protein Xfin-like [Branchiostoma floridae]|uniref:Zinc finger protein Xfin-like n=1 Tax=Branchiostoma floridae TaxID=7739 RepID=A0A9J7HHU8_BRAFL|nr:zinc finger protein Xfin-like [Branchiostoma floridae]